MIKAQEIYCLGSYTDIVRCVRVVNVLRSLDDGVGASRLSLELPRGSGFRPCSLRP
jgi:hypothetical protein